MPILRNPQHEKVAQELALLRKPYAACEAAGYDPANSSFKSTARKIVQRKDVQARKLEIMAKQAELAEIDGGWLLLKCKRMADFNVDDFLTKPNEAGVRYIDISKASRAMLEGLSELTVEEATKGRGASAVAIRHTKIKGEKLAALTLIAKVLELVKDGVFVLNVNQANAAAQAGQISEGMDAKGFIAARIEQIVGRAVGEPAGAGT